VTLVVRSFRDGDTIRLRELDARGVQVCGVEPANALPLAVAVSHEHFIYELDGEIAAAWGYAANGFGGARAFGWALTSPLCELHPLRFLRTSRREVDYVLQRFPALEVSVLKEHTVSQMWLTWLGFEWVREDTHSFVLEKVR
jgi:hypothetical protein